MPWVLWQAVMVTIFLCNKQFCVTLLDAGRFSKKKSFVLWYLSDLAVLGENLHYLFNDEQNRNAFSSCYWKEWRAQPDKTIVKVSYWEFHSPWNQLRRWAGCQLWDTALCSSPLVTAMLKQSCLQAAVPSLDWHCFPVCCKMLCVLSCNLMEMFCDACSLQQCYPAALLAFQFNRGCTSCTVSCLRPPVVQLQGVSVQDHS